jgi:hypothetical protein
VVGLVAGHSPIYVRDVERSEIIEAAKAWQEAESHYHRRVSEHIATWWGDHVPVDPPEPMALESLAGLQELRGEVNARFAAYQQALAHAI